MRSLIGACILLVLIASCGDDASESSPEPADAQNASDSALGLLAKTSITAPTEYSVTLTGSVKVGSGRTNFTQQATVYLRRTFDTTNVAKNGINPVDLGIKTTTGSPILGSPGALWFGTNTWMSAEISGSSAIQASRVDVAFVSIKNETITAKIDGDVMGLPTARINYLNVFNAAKGPAAQVYYVLSGTVKAGVKDKGKSVSGTIELKGSSGFSSGAATTTYSAKFSGKRA